MFLIAACKGETVVKIDPQTKTELDNCLEAQKDQKKLIASLQEENTKLQTKTTDTITVAIEGNILTVRPGKPGSAPPPMDDKATKLASQEFINVVYKSRGAIQKCYEQVLKKTPSLQSKPVRLTVQASFAPATGSYQNASFSPTLGDTFDNCIRAVATKWALSQRAPSMNFQASVELTPS
jgi:hypothetical protein